MFGVLPIDKPTGMTSRDVVNRIQRIVGNRRTKLGHTGTLDPLATGVLLVAVGPATRLTEIAHRARKHYTATFELDVESATLDTDSPIKPIGDPVRPDEAAWRTAASAFAGTIEQTPPAYSAVQVNGQRAYKLARQGKDVSLPVRTVTIHQLRTTRFNYPLVDIDIVCSTGTYIRTLGDDIAKSLGTRAVMRRLRRTRIGQIDVADCIALEDLGAGVAEHLLPPTVLLHGMPRVEVDRLTAARIRHGQQIRGDQLVLLDSSVSHRQTKNAARSASSTLGSPEAIAGVPTGDSRGAPSSRELSAGDAQEGMLAALDDAGDLVALLRRENASSYRPAIVFPSTQPAPQPSKTRTPHSPES